MTNECVLADRDKSGSLISNLESVVCVESCQDIISTWPIWKQKVQSNNIYQRNKGKTTPINIGRCKSKVWSQLCCRVMFSGVVNKRNIDQRVQVWQITTDSWLCTKRWQVSEDKKEAKHDSRTMQSLCTKSALWETLFPIMISTLQWNMRGTALDIDQLVGKNYLLHLHIMEGTAPDNGSGLPKEICISQKTSHQTAISWTHAIR